MHGNAFQFSNFMYLIHDYIPTDIRTGTGDPPSSKECFFPSLHFCEFVP